MGITCKPMGKFKGVLKKIDNQMEKEKAERTKTMKKETRKDK